MRDWLVTKGDSVSTLPQWSVAKTRWKSFKLIDGQVENTRRKCFYFVMMKCCLWSMCVLQTNWWTGREPKEKLLLLCDDEMLPLMDVRPSDKLMDRSRTPGENVSTLRWWNVASDGCASFKQIDGQVENRRRKCFFFCDDELLLLPEQSPLSKLMDRSKSKGENVYNLWWWSVAADGSPSFKDI